MLSGFMMCNEWGFSKEIILTLLISNMQLMITTNGITYYTNL